MKILGFIIISSVSPFNGTLQQIDFGRTTAVESCTKGCFHL